MTQPSLDLAEKIIVTVHDVLSKSPHLKSTRCLYTTTLISHLFEKHDIEHKVWQGTALWFSRRYVELRSQDIDPLDVTGLSEDKAKEKIMGYRKEGVRFVACNANERLSSEDLGGHLAIMAHIDGQYVFCDPTSYQFRRTKGKAKGNILAPEIFRSIINERDYKEPSVLTFVENKCLAYYKYEVIQSVQDLQNLSDKDRLDTDLNPNRHPDLLDEIEKKLAL